MKNRGIILALAMVVTMGLTACTPKDVEPVSTTEPSSSSEPIVSSEPKVTPSEAVPSDVPVSSDVEETAETENTAPQTDNATSSAGGNTSKPSGGNTSKPTTPPVTEKPSTPPASSGSSKSDEDMLGGSDVVGPEKTQEEIDEFNSNLSGKPADPLATQSGDGGSSITSGGSGGFFGDESMLGGSDVVGPELTQEEKDQFDKNMGQAANSVAQDNGSDNTQEEAPPIGGDPVDMSGVFGDLSKPPPGPGMTQEEADAWNNAPGAPGLSQ